MGQPVDPEAIEAEIDRIRSLGVDSLRMRWRLTFGSMPPAALTKDLIARMIAYRLQEDAFGGLDRATAKLLDVYARGDKARTELTSQLKPGTVLVREYQGERHTVTVVPDGFVWHETTYGSLSTIARAITGTAWNGPRFFGLRTRSGEQAGPKPDTRRTKPPRRGPPPRKNKDRLPSERRS
jgi:hypothetical protein